MALCDPGPFYYLPTDVLAYLAQFLNFRDRTALALTCEGYFNTLTDPDVAFLYLGGLRTRMVEALLQFEEWETLAKVMHNDHADIEDVLDRSFWKGSMALGERFPDLVYEKHIALAVLNGHGHVLERYPATTIVVYQMACEMRHGSIGLCDLALGVIFNSTITFDREMTELLLDVAASTRTQDEMAGIIPRLCTSMSQARLKGWCYVRGWTALGDRLFPDERAKFESSIKDLSLTRFFHGDDAASVLDVMDSKQVSGDLAGRTILNTPMHIIDQFYHLVDKRQLLPKEGGFVIVQRFCEKPYITESRVIWQQILDRAQGLRFPSSEICYYISPFYPPTTDPFEVCHTDHHGYAGVELIPAFDIDYYNRNVRVLRERNFTVYSYMVENHRTAANDHHMFDVMLQAASTVDPENRTDLHCKPLTRAAFAQGRLEEFAAAGYIDAIAGWHEMSEPQAIAVWELIQKHQAWHTLPSATLTHLPARCYQEALDLWVADPDQRMPFTFLASLPKSHRTIWALNYYGFREMFLTLEDSAIDALGQLIFTYLIFHKVLLEAIPEHELLCKIVARAEARIEQGLLVIPDFGLNILDSLRRKRDGVEVLF